MIVVLDTNVVISAIFFSKSLEPVLTHWASGAFSTALTKEIADEYIDVYQRMFEKYEALAEQVFKAIIFKSSYYDPLPLPKQICEDPDDDKFISCALSCDANYIVTGDKLLLAVNEIGHTKIITPKKFLQNF